MKRWEYYARRIRVGIMCPECGAYFIIEGLAGVEGPNGEGRGLIENPIKCPDCGEKFHVKLLIYYRKDGSVRDVYVKSHRWDGGCIDWPVKGPIDWDVLDLTSGSGGYSSYSSSDTDPRVGVIGRPRRVGPL